MIQSDHAQAPSTLADILRAVKAMFAHAADKTPVKVGEQHLTGGIGYPSILFIPETSGRIAGAIQSGHAVASWIHGCEVRVRAKPGIDEEDVFTPATALADKVIAALGIAAMGRLVWGEVHSNSPTPANSMGAELVFSFTFQRDIPHEPKFWGLPYPAFSVEKPIETVRTLANYTPAAEPTIPATLEGEPVVTPTVTPEEG